MVFRTQRLMPALLHRNLESVRGILARSTEDNVQVIIDTFTTEKKLAQENGFIWTQI